MALAPEFRGEQGPGWCAAIETDQAFNEYFEFINEKPTTKFKTRVALSFYCNLSEASGFYEIPKNLMRLVGGEDYSIWPFLKLNKRYRDTARKIAPNSNRIFQDLIGHASSLGLTELAQVFQEAFDADIRNAYVHADYILWDDGFRIRNRGCGVPRTISWQQFNLKIHRGIAFYQIIRALVEEYLVCYETPKEVVASMGGGQPKFKWRIEIDKDGVYRISSDGL